MLNLSLHHSAGIAFSPSMSSDQDIDPNVRSQEEEQELSALEYARQSGVSRNYLEEPLPYSHLEALLADLSDVSDDSHLPQFRLTSKVSTDERLEVSREGAKILAAITQDISSYTQDSLFPFQHDSRSLHRFNHLRVELPLLRSDHELDCIAFADRSGFELGLKDIKFPLERVNEENNEGLTWSQKLWNLEGETLQKVRLEKLEVTRDAMEVLMGASKANWTGGDEDALWDSILTYKKVYF